MKSNVLSVIMGGGRGTRLYPLTKLRSKPAVPLAGKFRLVDIPISNCLNSGINKIFLLTQFNTASLHRHIQDSYRFDPFGGGFVDILSAEQTEQSSDWYQGTADAVRHNLHHFHARDSDLFLILSGDQLYRMDFRKIIEQHRESGAAVTIAAKPVPKSEVSGLGVMRVNDALEIEEFVEKPKDPAVVESLLLSQALEDSLESGVPAGERALASMGIYVFDKKVLFDCLADTSKNDFGKEIIPSLLGEKKLCAHLFDDYWEDIGTIDAFFEANLMLAEPDPPFNFFEEDRVIYTHNRYLPASKCMQAKLDRVILADGSLTRGCELTRCVIGVRSSVAEGAVMEDVVMMGQDYFETDTAREIAEKAGLPTMGVGRNCHIRRAIIDKNARIGEDCKLSPEGKPDLYEEGDIFVRDGILIVNKNAVVPPGTVIGEGW